MSEKTYCPVAWLDVVAPIASPCRELCSNVQDVCGCRKVPVYQDCVSFLTKPRGDRKIAYCLEGLFKSSISDKKVQLLRQAYQLGRNPLKMLVGLQDPYAVAGLLQAWLQELPEPIVRSSLYFKVLQSQQYPEGAQRLESLQAVLKQNDAYRLRILLPLLELLHHYCINQRSIQHAAAYVAEKFVSCLLQPKHESSASGDSTAFAVSACISMVLDYRSLFGQSMVDLDSSAAQHSAALQAVGIQRARSRVQGSKPCPMPSSPMAAKRLPSSGLHFALRSEPEDFESPTSTPCLSPFFGSPTSDDLDSAFSATSMDTDDNRSCTEVHAPDEELIHAVDNLILESTSDLLFTSCNSDQSHQQPCPAHPEQFPGSAGHGNRQSALPTCFVQNCTQIPHWDSVCTSGCTA